MRSPITWFGGKGNMTAKLLPLIPRHHIYCEVFGGGGSVLFAKEPSNVEIYNDINADLFNFFGVLRNPEQFEQFNKLVNLTLFSRKEFQDARKSFAQGNAVERAWRFFTSARQSFAGQLTSWGYGVTSSSKGMASQPSRWLSALEKLPEVHARLMRVQVENDRWERILERYDTPETFFYLDPPYVPSTRKSGKYEHELSEADHYLLVDTCLKLKGKVLLSGYPNKIYQKLERSGWDNLRWKTICQTTGKTRGTKNIPSARLARVESVWMNYKLNT